MALLTMLQPRAVVYRPRLLVVEKSLETLMAEVQAGDAAAFEGLYRRMAPRVRGLLRALSNDTRLSEDLTQTTFLKVFRARDTWRPGAPVEPWVFAIARHAWLDQLRRRKRRPERVTEDGALPEPVAEEPAVTGFDRLDSESLAALERGMASLPESHREALLLLKVEGLSVNEAAAVAGVTPGNLKVRAHRAYEALRKALGLKGGAP